MHLHTHHHHAHPLTPSAPATRPPSLLLQIVLTNVVVAVLLDKFVEDPPGKGEDGEPPQQVDAASFLDGFDDDAGGAASSSSTAAAKVTPVPIESCAVSAQPMASLSPQQPQQAGSESAGSESGVYAAAGSPGGLIGNKSTDEKLSMLLVEIISLRVAVGRCEAGLDELRLLSSRNGSEPPSVLRNGKGRKSTPRKV